MAARPTLGAARHGSASLAARSLEAAGRRGPRARWRQLRRVVWSKAALAVLLLAAVAAGLVGWRATMVQPRSLAPHAALAFRSAAAGAEPLRFEVTGGGSASATLSGVTVTRVVRTGSTVEVWLPSGLPQGVYELQLRIDRSLPFGSSSGRWTVAIDDVAPTLVVDPPPASVQLGRPLTLTGTMEPGARLSTVDPTGTLFEFLAGSVTGTTPPLTQPFTLAFPGPPGDTLEVVATDAAGNATSVAVTLPVVRPGASKAVQLSRSGWANPTVRAATLALLDRGEIDTVVLDLKDESGAVTFGTAVALAADIGAVSATAPSLDDAVQELHGHGARIIGRVVTFSDPRLTRWAWANGRPEWVLQDRTGQPLDALGGVANYVQQPVREYNLALAEEAARAGIDEILWDGLGRPEGDPEEMVVPGLTGTGRTTADMMVEFLGQARARLRALGVYHGASLSPVAATRPENVGQPVDRMAAVVDVIAPRLFPSSLEAGECGLTAPATRPAEAVTCLAGPFQAQLAGTAAVLMPWVPDGTVDGVVYGPAEVTAQIQAAAALATGGYVRFNPASRYDQLGG
ncbi:MAG: putative glycoside hydrolase [Acidimicrobiales bacterium]